MQIQRDDGHTWFMSPTRRQPPMARRVFVGSTAVAAALITMPGLPSKAFSPFTLPVPLEKGMARNGEVRGTRCTQLHVVHQRVQHSSWRIPFPRDPGVAHRRRMAQNTGQRCVSHNEGRGDGAPILKVIKCTVQLLKLFVPRLRPPVVRSPLNDEKRPGTWECKGCGTPLFMTSAKYNSGIDISRSKPTWRHWTYQLVLNASRSQAPDGRPSTRPSPGRWTRRLTTPSLSWRARVRLRQR